MPPAYEPIRKADASQPPSVVETLRPMRVPGSPLARVVYAASSPRDAGFEIRQSSEPRRSGTSSSGASAAEADPRGRAVLVLATGSGRSAGDPQPVTPAASSAPTMAVPARQIIMASTIRPAWIPAPGAVIPGVRDDRDVRPEHIRTASGPPSGASGTWT